MNFVYVKKLCMVKITMVLYSWSSFVENFLLKTRVLPYTYGVLLYHREYREHVKDLSCISKDLSRIVIVDNNPFSFLLQPLNGIPCIPFSAGQPRDEQVYFTNTNSHPSSISISFSVFPMLYACVLTFFSHTSSQLLDVILPLLKYLSQQQDVRPALNQRFHMPEWFQKHGIPCSGLTT